MSSTGRMLHVVACLRAYATGDAAWFDFATMLITHHCGDPVAYLDQLAQGLVDEVRREEARAN